MVKKVKKCWIAMFGYALAFTAGLFGHVEQSSEGGFQIKAPTAEAGSKCCPYGYPYIDALGNCMDHY